MLSRVLETLHITNPAPAKKEEKKEIKVETKPEPKPESKTTKTSTPVKKPGGLVQKFKLRFLDPEEENPEKKFNNEMVKALEKVKDECKESQNDLKSKVIVLKYQVGFQDMAKEKILEETQKLLTKLKKKKKFSLKDFGQIPDTEDYDLFSKHVNPVLAKWEKNEKKPEAPASTGKAKP